MDSGQPLRGFRNDQIMTLSISPITDADVPAIIALWQRCGLTRPWNDPAGDIAFVRRGANATILVGRAIMAAAEDWLRGQGVKKIMLMVRPDNAKVRAFYDRLGYATQERVIYAKWLDGRPMTP